MTRDTPIDMSNPDPLLAALSSLARQALSGDPTRRDDTSFARVAVKVERQIARRRLAGVAVAAAAVVLAVLAGGSWLNSRERSVTYSVESGAVVDGDRIIASKATRVRFSEGSEVALEPGSETRIDTLDARGGHVSLREGTAKVAISKRPGAAWTLAAGPYSVRVTGTAFSLHWSEREQAFEISMQSGSVVVTGPLAGPGMTLHAGERLRSSLSEGKLTVAANDAVPRAAESGRATAAQPSGVGSDSATAETGPVATVARGETWAQKAAAGDFTAVIDAATARGIASTLTSAPLSDLSALADSARYVRRTDLARRTLLAQRARFPKSAAARDAAFFLGRIAQDEGQKDALEWYDRYLGESPGGPYVSQALGRKMMILYRQSGSSGARSIALDYLEHFPAGPYATAAGNIVREAKR